MCGRPSTTIGFERLFNPLARLDRQAFIQTLLDGVPPRPLNMTAIEATNRGLAGMEWAMPVSAPPVEELDIDRLEAEASDAFVLDVREPDEFAHGHVPGAVNIPQADLATRLDEIPRRRRVLAICHAGHRSLRAAQFLKQVGYRDVASVRGGTLAWIEAGKPLAYGDTSVERPHVSETRWAHAGAVTA